jgi:hypothetical protein
MWLHIHRCACIPQVMEEKDATDESKYTDLNDWLGDRYPDIQTKGALLASMINLYKTCCQVVGSVQESRCPVYPEYVPSGNAQVLLHLWQVGFQGTSFIRGSSTCCNVLKVLEKDILQGASTTKYPIEVVPFALGMLPGEPVEAFSLVTSIGSCVVTSAYCFCVYVMDKELLSGDMNDVGNRERLQPLCAKVLDAMNISAIHEPSKDLSDIVFKSNKSKIEASQRARPTILQYGISYSRVADQLISTKKSGRKSRQELIVEQIVNHNKKETVRSSRIKTDEIAALKNVVLMSDWAQRCLKVIWQSQLPPYSSVPITLLASRFLNPAQEVKVNKDEKPVWLDILLYNTSKSDAWLSAVAKMWFETCGVSHGGQRPAPDPSPTHLRTLGTNPCKGNGAAAAAVP